MSPFRKLSDVAQGFNPRELRLGLIAGVIVATSLLLWVGQPLWDRMGRLEDDVSSMTMKLEKLKRLLANRATIEQTYTGYQPYLSNEPDDRAQAAFLNDLEELARSVGIPMNLKPRPVQHESQLRRIAVELELETSQAKFLEFLDGLFRLPRLTEIEQIRLSTTTVKDRPLRAVVLVSKLAISR